MSGGDDAADRLRQYLEALETQDGETLDALIGEHTLLENPFLKPPRLFGRDEILRAHREILGQLETIVFKLDHCLGDRDRAVATGRLEFARRGENPRSFAAGAVAECAGGGLRRLSLYCDTRNLRRWSDRAIL